jgi:heavy metal sensor kinase
MFLNRLRKLRHTLAFRLTLWYAAIFSLSACVGFLFFYFLITTVIRDQTDQELLSKVSQFSTLMAERGVEAVKEMALFEAKAAGVKKVFFRLLYPSGEVFSSSNMSYWRNIHVAKSAIRKLIEGHRQVFENIPIPDRKNGVRVIYAVIGPGIILQVGQSAEPFERFFSAFKRMFLATMGMLLIVATISGWFMARRALAGLAAVTRTAKEISHGNLDKRVPVKPWGDEIDQLAITFNFMLDRIQTLIAGIREMSDNIAHDLKSPVTRIRGQAEITLTTAATRAEYETMAAGTIEDCDRLLDMINTMLAISRAEAGVEPMVRDAADMAVLVRDACELFAPMAEDKSVALSFHANRAAPVAGDLRKLQRMVANLLDNAIKYTPAGGAVTVAVDGGGTLPVTLTVTDTGVGMAPSERVHIFERFYRCDHSRSPTGAGLGLSLARAIARGHGGDIAVVSRPGLGSTFTVTLPCAGSSEDDGKTGQKQIPGPSG